MPPRVIIAGAIAQHPIGGAGNTWAFLQYVLGFRALGCETYYFEEIDPQRCIAGDWSPASFADSANGCHLSAVAARFGFDRQYALLSSEGGGHFGLSHADAERIARDADLFVNISGRFHLRRILDAPRRRLYLDMDPGFVQIWQQQYGVDMNLRGHDVHVTVGLNLGAADCPIPDCGVRWHTTLPPVVLSEWETEAPPGPAYTTVAD